MPVSAVAESSSAAAVVARRQPLLTPPLTSWNHRSDAGKDGASGGVGRAGETAGECAAVCCCCPCAVVHLVILALYRLPRGLWRRKKKRKMLLRKKRGKLAEEKDGNRWKFGNSFGSYTDDDDRAEELGDCGDYEGQNGVVDRENEMWDRFYWSGFWRSSSQREEDDDECDCE